MRPTLLAPIVHTQGDRRLPDLALPKPPTNEHLSTVRIRVDTDSKQCSAGGNAVSQTPAASAAFQEIFNHVRDMYRRLEHRCVVLRDEPHRYYLGTHEIRAKDGYRTWFGGVEIKQTYVSAHLIPVYACPDLLEGISPDLRRRMQGKSCFNFRKMEPVIEEFGSLVEVSARRFDRQGRLSSSATQTA